MIGIIIAFVVIVTIIMFSALCVAADADEQQERDFEAWKQERIINGDDQKNNL